MNKIRAGIVGGTGYTAGELLRILLRHPCAEIAFVYTTSQAGQPVATVHTDLLGDTELRFSDETAPADVAFLCLGHGVSRAFLTEHPFPAATRVIDLGSDFRLDGHFEGREFVYGLPEARREQIRHAANIANPGCFATAMELALLPLAKAYGLAEEVHAHAVTGSTGAGRSPGDTTHFSWRNNNLSVYKPFTHQHMGEIQALLGGGDIRLIPLRGNFSRGILATLYTRLPAPFEEVYRVYEEFYRNAPFTHVTRQDVSLKDAVNTNKCLLQLQSYDGLLLITSVIDNLLKGASGQAVQNMNLMFGLDERCGLELKPLGL